MILVIFYVVIFSVYLIFDWAIRRYMKLTIKYQKKTISHQAKSIRILKEMNERENAKAKNYKALAEGKPFIIHIDADEFSRN